MHKGTFKFSLKEHRILIFSILAGLIAFSSDITYLIASSDYSFHEGEYLGLLWNITAFYKGQSLVFPLLMHGAMDYIPGIISLFIYGGDHAIVATRILNTAATWACWVLFLDIIYLLTSKTRQKAFLMALAVLIFFLLAPGFNSKPLDVHDAFLGPRDLFLIASIWAFTNYIFSEEGNNSLYSRLFLISGGILTAISFFWCYDRGIMTLAFFFLVLMGIILNKKTADAFLTFIVFSLSLGIIGMTRVFGPITANLENAVYWVQHSAEIWGKVPAYGLGGMLSIFCILAFAVLTVVIAIKEKFYKNKKEAFLVLAIMAVQLILLKGTSNRPDIPHLRASFWPSILLMFYLTAGRISSDQPVVSFNFYNSFKNAGGVYRVYFLVLLLLSCFFVFNESLVGYGKFARNVFKPANNSEVVAGDIINMSNALSRSKDRVVLGWVNDGVLTFLSKKKFATKYPYAIYVCKNEEKNYLRQVKGDSLSVVVFNMEDDQYMKVDGRSMQSRLPEVYKYIQLSYRDCRRIDQYFVVGK
ncbi:MAG: hypothetical protein HF314_06360 [Ignavibacteria bacterium]|jgi:hypothetical protein|nr:hypothetical protein [Ignavibacteria bacterium]MCU7502677.1 hypothetical protein [Ignavibacteria bacterium]MCU7515120.1 hypothetical protein [Ignavibacteria bacterium]